MTVAYDPLNYDNLARNVVQALLDSNEVPLPPTDAFEGAGVYAVYYHGDFAPYAPIVGGQPPLPIYVGKAVPVGARKGGVGSPSSARRELWNRLREHAESIEAARNLRAGDFTCRYLVVVPVWVSLAERFLVAHFKPIWNVVIDGFGNHDPGAGRRGMKRPRWDIVHPGRHWAERLEAAEDADAVLGRLRSFLESR